jgi:hypothetical protein
MKRYSIGLITGILLGISAMMFMGAQNKNLGDVVVNSITVNDSDGNTSAYFGNLASSDSIDASASLMFYSNNEIVSVIGVEQDGQPVIGSISNNGRVIIAGGRVLTMNAKLEDTAILGTDPETGKGFCNIFNPAFGETAVITGSNIDFLK